VTSLAHRAHATSPHNVRKSPHRRPPVERAARETVPWAQFARGHRVERLFENFDGRWTCEWGARHVRFDKTAKVGPVGAPTIEGHYANAGWLSSGIRLKYRPFTATSGPKNHPQVIEVFLTELGQLGLGLLGAPRERTRFRHRGEVATGLRCLGCGRQGRLRGHGVFAALGKNLFDLGVRAAATTRFC
jgi:hypothetical protein